MKNLFANFSLFALKQLKEILKKKKKSSFSQACSRKDKQIYSLQHYPNSTSKICEIL